MSEYQPSAALLRTRLMSRSDSERDQFFATGRGTKPATQAHVRQTAALSVHRVVKQAARRRPTTEERQKEIGRRRTWAGGGNMPPTIRAGYTEAERAALSVIADKCRRKGFCDLCLDEIARLAGVSRTSVQNAIRKAKSRERSHITVRERPQEHGKHLTHVIKIVCASWIGWIKRAIGFKRLNTSETGVKNSLSLRVEPDILAFEREGAVTAGIPQAGLRSVANPSTRWGVASRWAHGFGGSRSG
jgi:hypothetical protein